MKIAAAYLALLFCFSSTCCAQSQTAPAATNPSTKPRSTTTDDSMVLIPGGTFQMGIDPADIPRFQKIFAIENARLFQDELPRHTVIVKDFYIDKNLVTNAQFKAFVDANPDWSPDTIRKDFDNGNYLQHWASPASRNARPTHPVVNVNWFAAASYCIWAGKRLPTEAEWEFAAGGGQNRVFPWGDELPDETRANFNDDVGTTTPVGAYPPNPYGLHDMAGNAWQFLADGWAPYSAAELQGPPLLVLSQPGILRRVIRGGSYAGHAVNLWIEYRDSHPSNGSQPFVGFRCAQPAPSRLS